MFKAKIINNMTDTAKTHSLLHSFSLRTYTANIPFLRHHLS